ncbi:MAG TPA: MarR family transcriptional regulator [Acetobacteraceae bacterium]|nr:MarR family transcriptional regulator [Acetobacteraceae bacterium]
MNGDNDAAYRNLTRRPGFLIRRLHQIHLALFYQECGTFGVTPVQYSIMTAIDRHPRLDQASLGEQVGIDRATIADVLTRLENRGLVSRRRSAADARMKLVSLTAAGRRLLTRIDPHAQQAHQRTVAALPPEARAAFIAALTRLVAEAPIAGFNGDGADARHRPRTKQRR